MLRVKDFTWHPGYMELVEAELDEAMRGEVKLRRVKRHYHERSYGYEMSVTPDALEVARRAATWLLVYMWRRALFMVQYDGMSAAAQQAAWAAREQGFSGGMPPGAVISAEEAIARLKAGERAYVRVEFGPGDVRSAGDER